MAEELDVAFERVTMIMGDTALDSQPGCHCRQQEHSGCRPGLAASGRRARLVLLTRASEQLGVPADDLQIRDGVVSALGDETQSVRYGQLASEHSTAK